MPETNKTINKEGMTSASEAINTFEGDEAEKTHHWLQEVKMIAFITEISEKETKKRS